MVRLLFLLILVLQLSGCFLAPGMRMKAAPCCSRTCAIQTRPCFIPITVDLVRYIECHAKLNQDDSYYYHVSPHDVLNIYVWGHPELIAPSGPSASEQGVNAGPSIAAAGYLVDPDGNIFYPLVGTVHVAGSTVQQDRIHLTHLLKKYIRNPQMDIRVIGFRSKKFYVMGEVDKPGLFPLTDAPMSITDAINIAGGLVLKSADPGHIFVIRGNYAYPDVYWLNASSPDALLLGEKFLLRDRDVVFVSTAGVAQWNRAIEQILPTIQTAWFTYSLTHY